MATEAASNRQTATELPEMTAADILVGIFVVLVAIVRTLTMVPARLGFEIEG